MSWRNGIGAPAQLPHNEPDASTETMFPQRFLSSRQGRYVSMLTMVQLGFCARTIGWFVSVATGLLLVACGSNSGESNGSGQVTDEWSSYCVATFTRDVAIADMGSVAFTARTGERYLLTDYNTFGGEPLAKIAYLTAAGPEIYDVPMTGSVPFTSNCTIDKGIAYYAVFTDVTVYDSEALKNEICSLSAGTVVPLDSTTNAGYSTTSFNFSGPQTYDVFLNALGTQCGGATDGYVSVDQTTVLGVTTWLVPIVTILKPS